MKYRGYPQNHLIGLMVLVIIIQAELINGKSLFEDSVLNAKFIDEITSPFTETYPRLYKKVTKLFVRGLFDLAMGTVPIITPEEALKLQTELDGVAQQLENFVDHFEEIQNADRAVTIELLSTTPTTIQTAIINEDSGENNIEKSLKKSHKRHGLKSLNRML